MNNLFDRAYDRICRIDTTLCGIDQLCGIVAVQINVHTAVSLMPWLDEAYGTPAELCGRIGRVAEALMQRTERESNIGAKTAGLNALFDVSNVAVNTQRENFILKQACALAEAYDPLSVDTASADPTVQADICRLFSSCYYMSQEQDFRLLATHIVGTWSKTQTTSGAWEGLAPTQALQRLFAMDAYRNYILDPQFDEALQQGMKHYLNSSYVPQHNGMPTDAEIDTVCRMAELLSNTGYTEPRNLLAEHIDQLLGHYISSWVADSTLSPTAPLLRATANYEASAIGKDK